VGICASVTHSAELGAVLYILTNQLSTLFFNSFFLTFSVCVGICASVTHSTELGAVLYILTSQLSNRFSSIFSYV